MWADIICKHCGKQFRAKTIPSKRRNYCSLSCGAHVSKNRGHGYSGTRIHANWLDMRYRCRNPNYHSYRYYGGRGIKVCERWDTFENFIADMGPKPGPDYSIERIDSNGDYEPSNCKWGTKVEQSRNRRNTYTAEQDQKIREAISWGYNFRQVAEYVGKSNGSVMTRAYRLGLKSGTPPIPKKDRALSHSSTEGGSR